MINDVHTNPSAQAQPPRNGAIKDAGKGYSLPDIGTELPKVKTGAADGERPVEILQQEDLKKITENLNKLMQSKDIKLQFSLDDESGRTIIKVINKETDEVIRQFPPEEILYLSRTINSNFDAQIDDTSGFLIETEV